MPNLTVILTDEQWTAYQAVNEGVSLDDVSAWLKRQFAADYQRKLEGADQTTAENAETTAVTARRTKLKLFPAIVPLDPSA